MLGRFRSAPHQARTIALHEDLERESEVGTSSDRSFGFVFTVAWVVIALWPTAHGRPVRLWALALAAIFLTLALLLPASLAPLNRLWARLGLILHHLTNPVIMGLLFYLTLTPFGLVMRLFGRDPLRRRFESDAETYWIPRRPPGPAPDTMRNQF
jgi:hypothetical protein